MKPTSRGALMLSTALQAVAMALTASPALAQLAANARPGGSQVTAGQARIGGNATTTLITQTSEKAAINWQSYNVGSAQTVRYAQPNAGAITLNNVLSANPSLIAGKILANGQIIIVNQSGVVFAKGAQVDTAGLIVSSAGISKQDFMAGRMVFSQAGHPGALISNAGNITVRQAGLAALVAPQVVNSGTITANLGRVILGGATTHTLDLYGDGLVALNVTGQVTQVSLDGKLVPALVTNSGTILAPGGTVVLTAAAADGVVTNLVSAGGTIAAPSVGGQTGRVLVQGIGGGITIDGQVSATGVAAGTKGGQVEVNASGAVNVGSGAVIDASGDAGGGVISVGTTAARALGGPSVHPTLTAQSVAIAAGARIRANATRAGQGGRIAVLSRSVTRQAGAVTATGGAVSGNGGWAEISGQQLALGGAVDAGAAHGRSGTILLDPLNMVLEATGASSSNTLAVTQAEISRELNGNVILQASGTLSVSSAVTFNTSVQFLQLEGDQAVVIDAAVIAKNAAVGLKSLSGSITEGASGSISATSISAKAATQIDLAGQNTDTTVTGFSNNSQLANQLLTGIVVTANANGGTIPGAGPPSASLEIAPGQMPGLTAGTTIALDVLPTPGSSTPNTLTIDGVIEAGTLSAGAYSGSTTLNVTTGNIVESAGASILTGTLSGGGTAIGGSADFGISAGNTISTLTNFRTTGDFSLEDDTSLTAGSLVSTGGGISITGPASVVTNPGSLTIAGPITAATAISLGNTLGIGIGGTLSAGPTASASGTTYGGLVTLDVAAGNIVETTGGAIRAGTLAGEALSTAGSLNAASGNATLTTAGNTISTLTGFSAAGNFALQDASGLTVGALTSSFGSLAIAGPATGTPSGTLSLAGTISAGTSMDFSNALGIGISGTLSAGAVFTDGPTFYHGLVTLDVANGNIAETASGAIRAGSLSGEALSSAAGLTAGAGNATLTSTAGNIISTLTGFTADGNFALEDGAGLTVGALSSRSGGLAIAGPAAGNPTGSLTLAGTITAGTSISFSNALGIAEIAGASVASTASALALSTGGAISQAAGSSLAGSSSTGTALSLSAGTGMTLAGISTAGTAAGGGYSGLAVLAVSDGNIDESGGVLRAGTLGGEALSGATTLTAGSGNATFTSTAGNTVGVLTGFTADGNFSMEDGSGLTVGALSSRSGSLSIVGPATGSPTGSLVLAGAITAGTSISFSNALGISETAGASVASTASALTLSTGGAISQAAGSSLAGSPGTGTAISLAAGTGITLSGTVTAGTLASHGTAYSGSAAFSVSDGSIAETTGGVRAGTLRIDASGGIALDAESSAATGNQIATLAAASAGGNFQLADGQTLAITGAVRAGLAATTPSSLAIIAPEITENAGGSLAISPPNGTAPGILSLVADQFSFVSAGVQNAGGIVALDLLNTTSFAVGTAAGATISPASLQNIQTGSGTLAIGSLDGTRASPADASSAGWTIGTGGTVELIGITAPLDLKTTGVAASLGLFSNGAITSSAGFTVSTLYGTSANGTTAISGSNAVSTLSAFSTAETPSAPGNATAFLLDDSVPLTVLGPVTAGQGAVDISVGQSNGLTLGASGGGGFITGTDIDLSAAGAISQVSGTLDATGATNANQALSTPGSIVLISTGGGIALGTHSAALTAPTAHGVILLYAGGGDITENAAGHVAGGTLAAEASGNIQLISTTNTVSFVAPLTALVNGVSTTVSGLVASGTGGIGFSDVAALTVADGALISAFGPAGTAGPGTGTISLAAGAFTLGVSTGATIAAPGNVALNAARGITQTGGIVLSDANTELAAGSLLSFGGTVTAGTLSGGGAYSGTAVFDVAAGNITETTGGILRAGTLSSGGTSVGGSAGFAVSAGNTVGTLTDFRTTGNFALEDDTALTIGTLAATAGGITIGGPGTAVSSPGSLTVTGPVSAGTSISLANTLGIVLSGTLTAGTFAAGGYSGLATLDVFDGNIAENVGASIRAGTLSGEALSLAASPNAGAGNATFSPTAGNTIGALANFTADGNVALEDDSGLTVGGLSARFGSIAIGGPAAGAPTGSLVLAGGITAGTSASFSNALGIAEISGAAVTAASGLSLSTGGSIIQSAASSLAGGSSTGTAVALSASTGITLAGTLTAGSLSAGSYSGLAVLDVTGGNIAESGSLRAGTLSGEALSSAASLTAAAGNATFSPAAGNILGTLTGFTARGNFALEDDFGLTIGALTSTFGSLGIVGPGHGSPAGGLILAGDIVAGTSASFSNALGISEASGAAVSSAAGLSLSTGGAISQAATSSLTGGQTGGAVVLSAGTGITLAGTITAGTLAAGSYTGLATIGVANGNIIESGGILRAGTLGGDALSTAGSLTAASGNATFTATPGNTLSTLTGFTADGNFALEDDTGLTIGALSARFGGLSIAGPATGNPTGRLALNGTITAGTSISFSNALGISELAGAAATATTNLAFSTAGSITQAAASSLAGGSSSGTAVSLSASTGITLSGTTTAGTLSGGGYTGLAVLDVTGGNIVQTSGSLRAGTLSGEALSSTTSLTAASGNASFSPAAGNTIGTLTRFTADGNFALEDDSGLTIGALSSAFGSIGITGPSPGTPSGSLVLAGDITAATSISFSNAAGIGEQTGAAVGAASLLLSTGGAITQAAGSSLAGSRSTGIAVALTAGTGMALAGTTTAGTLSGGSYTGLASLDVTGGNIAESAGIIRAGSLVGEALSGATSLTAASGNANFTSAAGNSVGTLTGFTADGNFALEDTAGLTVEALSAKFGSISISGPATGSPTGSLVLGGAITAATSASFSNALGIAEAAGASVSAGSGLSLATGGAITQAAGASLAGGSVTGTAVALSAGTGITLSGTTTAGSFANGGFTGLAAIDATGGGVFGDSGILRAGTLTSGGGTIGGSGRFAPSAGNTIGTLTDFATAGDFALEDDTGLTIGGLTAGGSIAITGPGAAPPAGILVIAGAVSAGANLSLGNALGIAELASGSVISTGGSIALVSGGAIVQQAGGAMAGAAGLSLAAGGSTPFNTYLPGQAFGTVNGIAFGGTLAAPAGTLSLTASQGDIGETGPGATTSTGILQTGLLSAIAHTGTLSGNGLIILDTPSSATTGNQISGLGAAAADGAFVVADGASLGVSGAVQAGLRATTPTALQIIAPAIDVMSGSLAIAPPGGTKPGILSLVADQFTFAAAGDVSSPGGIVSLDLLNPGTSGATVFGIGPTATVSAASLTNIRTAGGTLALGSLDGTLVSPGTTNLAGWTAGEAGIVDQIRVAAGQTVDLTTATAALGLFTNATSGTISGIADLGGIGVGSLYGIAGGPFTQEAATSNLVGTLGVATQAGTLFGFSVVQAPDQSVAVQFTDARTLEILGPLAASAGSIDISVTGTTGSVGSSITLGGTITGSGDITAGSLFLSAAGNIVQAAGSLDATQTNGVIGLAAGGAISLQGRSEAGTGTGALLLSAATGDVSETASAHLSAGTLAAAAGGDILLGTGTNAIGFISPFASTTQALFLNGLTAEGAAGIAFTDRTALTVADGALVSAFGPAGTAGPGTGSITVSLTSGGLALGTVRGATIAAPGNITLTAPGSIVQTGGSVQANGDISLSAGTLKEAAGIGQAGGTIAAGGSVFATATGPASGSADISQTTLTIGQASTGSTITAGQDVTLVSATGSFAQTGSSITGSNAVTIDVRNTITQSAGGTIAAPGSDGTVILASAGGSIVAGGLIAGGGTLAQGGVFTPAGSSAVLLSAAGGDILEAAGGSIDAGTLAAAATGNISLPGNNQVSTIGSLGATLAGALPQTLALYGLGAAGPAGISFTDISPLGALRIGPDTGAHAVIDASGSNATLAITFDGAGNPLDGSLVLGGGGASSLLAGGAITLESLGSILQDAGTIRSAAGGINLVSTMGSVQQTGSTIAAAGGNVAIRANGSVSQSAGATIAAGSLVSLTSLAGSFTQSGSSLAGAAGVTLGFAGNVNSAGGEILSTGTASAPGTVSITSSGGAIAATQGARIEADGTGSVILLSAAGDIGAGEINTGTLAAMAGGSLLLDGSNSISAIAANGTFSGLAARTGTIDLADQLALTVQPGAAIEALAPSAGITIAAAALTLTQSSVEAGGGIALSAAGAFGQTGGLVQSEQGSVGLSGQSFSATGGAAIIAGHTVAIGSSGSLAIANASVQAGPSSNGTFGGALLLSAGSAGIEAGTGTLLTGTLAAFSTGPVTLSDPANEIAVIGTAGTLAGISAGGSLAVQDAQSLNVAAPVSAGGPIGFTILPGAFTDDAGIGITANGPLSISATGAVSVGGSLGSGDLSVAAGGGFTELAGASITAHGTAAIDSKAAIQIDGFLGAAGAAHIAAATDLGEGPAGLIAIPAPATLTAPGSITLDGAVSIPGSLTILAGADFVQGAGGTIASGNTMIGAGSSITISGLLQTAPSFTVTAGTDFTEAATGAITLNAAAPAGQAAPVVSIAANGLISIGGVLSYPDALSLSAGAFTESAGATMSSLAQGTAIGVSVARGPAVIDGRMSAAGTLGISAGTAIAQGATSTISAGSTASLLSPGTITLAGLLSAPDIILGDTATSAIDWDGNTIRTGGALHGPTKAINRLLPLGTGPGLLVDAASLHQTGTTFVDPLTGGSATLQITVQGKGTAHFDALDAPDAQLLLVLQNGGFANGLIDVSGLNVFFTQGDTPSQAATLFGTVGGHGGTAAAAAGFAHLNSNINYQVNGCPIQSINCVLLSPVVVPVVNPVNDFAEGTQRKRHQDDDALPNVGEEDY